ncbi:hypothetical protein Tco_0955163 [Tanacetum coccineum]|uniref:Uncharacterized protein n=1 Tax=Tanacetum coccineum TaxID=301880 RepID=A0ABQ5E6J0_9ASTR
MTYDESPPPTKLSPLVDDYVVEEEAIENNIKVVNNHIEDEPVEVDNVVNIKESKNHPLGQHSLEVKRSGDDYPYIEFKLGSFTFQLSLSMLSRIFNTASGGSIFYTYEWSLNFLDTHFNNRFFHPEPELVKQTITIPRTTNRKLQRDSNTLFHDDLRSEVQRWELFIQENVFSVLGKLSKTKEKRADPPSSSLSSSSSDENEEPSFLEFYEELSNNENLTNEQKKKRGMFKCLNRYFDTITKYLKKQK